MTTSVPAPRAPAGRVAKPTLSERIRDGLVEAIVSGDLESGERLVETKIAADYGTSQAPVREALRELEGLGLIESRPRRGRHVLPFVEQTLREAYVVRAALEEAATRLALIGGQLPWEALEADVVEMYRSAEGEDLHAMGVASSRFHRRIVQASGNLLLDRAWEGLQIEARTAIALVVAAPDLNRVAVEHADLLEVLRAGDVDRACLHARVHQWAYADLPHDLHGVAHPATTQATPRADDRADDRADTPAARSGDHRS
ncbi:GntR family transcriptional regulator [Nocardioides dongxiaopingii]|uniref:GntR family transcriptional regulator n=1 Tax=Nocardioides dongxiaopingii TaxID=2576036 RepID=UPI0010C76C0A|nr:GntR family transcriptional regulator [Nocardioides dongxiaopingii]